MALSRRNSLESYHNRLTMPSPGASKKTSMKQASFHTGNANKPKSSGPKSMDLSAVQASNFNLKRGDMKMSRGNRCGKMGHFAYECMATKTMPRSKQTELVIVQIPQELLPAQGWELDNL